MGPRVPFVPLPFGFVLFERCLFNFCTCSKISNKVDKTKQNNPARMLSEEWHLQCLFVPMILPL